MRETDKPKSAVGEEALLIPFLGQRREARSGL